MTLSAKHTLLFVDDEEFILNSLKRTFRKQGYQILTASNGNAALEILSKLERPVSLIISDQQMPIMGGYEFLEKSKKYCPDAIRFLLTGHADISDLVKAVNRGEIHRYIAKPWNDDDLMLQVKQFLQHYEQDLEIKRLTVITKKQNKQLFDISKDLKKEVDKKTKELRKNNEELEKSFINAIRLLASLVEILNPQLGQYMQHVTRFALEIGEIFNLSTQSLNNLEMAAMVHDIGLLGFPKEIMSKLEEEMNPREYDMYIQHPIISQACLNSIRTLDDVGKIVLHHHEHYDGNGFPENLKREEIPIESRILAVVSEYCRIMTMWPKDPIEIIKRSRKFFGPAIKDFKFINSEDLLKEIAEKIIMLNANAKYDMEVVINLIKKVRESRIVDRGNYILIDIDNLIDDMILERNLRSIEGDRVILTRGTKLNDKLIKALFKIHSQEQILDKIHILKSSVPKELRSSLPKEVNSSVPKDLSNSISQ